MRLRASGPVGLWGCGPEGQWACGPVDLWTCGAEDKWGCGAESFPQVGLISFFFFSATTISIFQKKNPLSRELGSLPMTYNAITATKLGLDFSLKFMFFGPVGWRAMLIHNSC